MKTCQIKEVVFGDGSPKICIPIVAENKSELQDAVTEALTQPVECLEWRIDLYRETAEQEEIIRIAHWLKSQMQEKVLIVTYRTQAEGGAGACSRESYYALLSGLLEEEATEILDVEWQTAKPIFKQLKEQAQAHGVKLLASSHHFDQTPPAKLNLALLKEMATAGADFAKLAVMPQNEQDVLDLMAVTRQAVAQLPCPVITMSMGTLGRISRISGELTGSALTFAAEKVSAPGQLSVATVRTILAALQENER